MSREPEMIRKKSVQAASTWEVERSGHKRIMVPAEASVPCDDQRSHCTASTCANEWSRSPVVASQTRTRPSCPAEASNWPFGDQASAEIGPWWACSPLQRSAPSTMRDTERVPASPPRARQENLGRIIIKTSIGKSRAATPDDETPWVLARAKREPAVSAMTQARLGEWEYERALRSQSRP